MSAQQQIIRDLHKKLKLAKLEIFSLQNRNDLQHSSWMLCDQLHKKEVSKLKFDIGTLEWKIGQRDNTIQGLRTVNAANNSLIQHMLESPSARLWQWLTKLFRL